MTTTVSTPLQRTVSANYLAFERGVAYVRAKSASDDITFLFAALSSRARQSYGVADVSRMRREFADAMRELDSVLRNGYLDSAFRDSVRRYRDAAGAYYRAPEYERCTDTRCKCRGCAMRHYTQALRALRVDLLQLIPTD